MYASENILTYARRGGYGKLHDGCVSDHVMLWADFDFRQYFGGLGPKHVPPQAREFSVDNIEIREILE